MIVEGALEQEEDCEAWDGVQNIINEQTRAAMEDGRETQIYVLQHDHKHLEDDECSCDQYLSDHAPYLTLNSRDALLPEEVPCAECDCYLNRMTGECPNCTREEPA